MTLLGRLLANSRADETRAAWHLPNLQGPDLLTVSSEDFTDGGPMPKEHSEKRTGGGNLSPHLAWTAPPAGTAQLLLVMEDLDIPLSKTPVVHTAALIDPTTDHLAQGALDAEHPGVGVQLMRSTIGRGYHGPGPVKGHGPHRYVFQLFALATPLTALPDGTPVARVRPRKLLPAVTAQVLGRGRLTGTYER
ncbi:YbhB/YbcL family Raf kinase inhibitor-like protein [Streptomyces sp. NPDC001941]|uniref:YbhB/YbcL family Raf kinase inhibitor-like protein n=1 Tax=Streptomyces sp. NPDC001941 TaxID=3154659 RepID=UPI0033324878